VLSESLERKRDVRVARWVSVMPIFETSFYKVYIVDAPFYVK